jgi:hypothetical protein
VSAVTDAIGAIRDALKLSDDVKRAGEALKAISEQLRDHEHRIIRLETKWETAMEFSRRAEPRRIKGS